MATLKLIVPALLAGAALVPGLHDAPAARAGAAPTVQVLVESSDPAGAPGRTLRIYRVKVPSGSAIAPHFHPGTQASIVTRGTLSYWVIKGGVTVRRGDPDAPGGARAVHRVKAGQKVKIASGEWIVEQPGTIHRAANEGRETVEIEITSLVKTGGPLSLPAGP